eukprot:20185-Heterococcus_DN1.PRE.7
MSNSLYQLHLSTGRLSSTSIAFSNCLVYNKPIHIYSGMRRPSISLKTARDDYSYVNTVALFFMKRGFSYVSVVQGGFAGAHDALASTGTEVGLTTLVDHVPQECHLCDDVQGQSSSSLTASSFKITTPNIFKRVSVKGTGSIFKSSSSSDTTAAPASSSTDEAVQQSVASAASMPSYANMHTQIPATHYTAAQPVAASSVTGNALTKAFAEAFPFMKDSNKGSASTAASDAHTGSASAGAARLAFSR